MYSGQGKDAVVLYVFKYALKMSEKYVHVYENCVCLSII